jgi:hypothetical protein
MRKSQADIRTCLLTALLSPDMRPQLVQKVHHQTAAAAGRVAAQLEVHKVQQQTQLPAELRAHRALQQHLYWALDGC